MQIAYILGTTRSGTSAVRNAISQTRYKGFGEGHTVGILSSILDVVRKEKASGQGTNVNGTALNALREKVFIRHIFHSYERYFEETLKTNFVLDKTPNIIPINLAPVLNEFHQDARFIYFSRRHIDNIFSKIKKFPNQSFESMCREWAACNRSWREVRDELPGRYVDFDFYELVTAREEVAAKIGALLDLDTAEVNTITAYLTKERPEARMGRDLLHFRKLSELDWDEEKVQTFTDVCGPLGQEMGYGLEAYFEDSGPGLATGSSEGETPVTNSMSLGRQRVFKS